MASYVIVWENNTFGHMKVKGHTWPGHASLNIGEEFESLNFGFGMGETYVSWWPSDDADDGKAKGSDKGGLKGLSGPGERNMYFGKDIRLEGYLPDHVICLESDTDREARMVAAYKEIYQKRGASYKYLRKNCSTIVSRVLHAGGYYAKKWAMNCNFVWTPADIRKLAIGAGGSFMQWDDVLAVLANSRIAPTDLKSGMPMQQVTMARSGAYCTTGAPCRFQQDQQQTGGRSRNAIILD